MSPIYGIDSDQKIDQLRRFNSSATPKVESLNSLMKASLRKSEPEIEPEPELLPPSARPLDPEIEKLMERLMEFKKLILSGEYKSSKDILDIIKNLGTPNKDGKFQPYFNLEQQMTAMIYLLNEIDDPSSDSSATPIQRQAIMEAYSVVLLMQDELTKIIDVMMNPTRENGGKIDFEES